ncbi:MULTISPECIES: gluconokinase [unclassified Colwellia]|uniref:gluconokinase n=1 Tax=unclassified Colwellia TaxID=196834 RepID=UPI0021752484|nr:MULTISPECIES: gluconokinase, GntK/IdnK-type [unclassified Colwellia]
MLTSNEIKNKKTPILVVVMGVSGCGKTTLAQEIASHFDITFLDADSFHNEDAIKQMSQGIPLTDKQREPWIKRIGKQLNLFESQNKSCVLAYSGLKKQHRKSIFDSYLHGVAILLNADQSLIEQRLESRKEHFMSSQLLSSQITSMEPINAETEENLPVLILNAEKPVKSLLLKSIRFIL